MLLFDLEISSVLKKKKAAAAEEIGKILGARPRTVNLKSSSILSGQYFSPDSKLRLLFGMI